MTALSAYGTDTELARAPARPIARDDRSLSRVQAELALSHSELRRMRDALRDEVRRREAAESALADARRQHAGELARVARLSTAGETAGALAHQLGQPLAATLNYLHGCQLRLQHGGFEPESIQAALALAIEQVEQAGGIVGHVRNFVSRHVPDARAIDLHALIRQTLRLIDDDCRSHGIEMHLCMAADAPQASADPLEVQQVLLNLLRNAIDAMSTTGDRPRVLQIETQIIANGQRIEVVVSDSGPGVAVADLPRIFESWYTTKRNGLGLGLAVCRTIVESHGGTLRVDTGSAGGAAFRFDLSRVEQA